jgi:hypothetical protein
MEQNNLLRSNDTELQPVFVPSQIQSDTSPLRFSTDNVNLSKIKGNRAKLGIIQVMSLLPPLLSKDIFRQVKTQVDNTLFVYPFQFEKFSERFTKQHLK